MDRLGQRQRLDYLWKSRLHNNDLTMAGGLFKLVLRPWPQPNSRAPCGNTLGLDVNTLRNLEMSTTKNQLLQRYTAQLTAHPLRTKAITAGQIHATSFYRLP